MPWAHSILLTEPLDEARRQMGVIYNQDKLFSMYYKLTISIQNNLVNEINCFSEFKQTVTASFFIFFERNNEDVLGQYHAMQTLQISVVIYTHVTFANTKRDIFNHDFY